MEIDLSAILANVIPEAKKVEPKQIKSKFYKELKEFASKAEYNKPVNTDSIFRALSPELIKLIKSIKQNEKGHLTIKFTDKSKAILYSFISKFTGKAMVYLTFLQK